MLDNPSFNWKVLNSIVRQNIRKSFQSYSEKLGLNFEVRSLFLCIAQHIAYLYWDETVQIDKSKINPHTIECTSI